MADEIKINRPTQQPVQVKPEYSPAVTQENKEPASHPTSKTPWITLAIVVLLLGIGGVVFRDKLLGKAKTGNVLGATTNGYEAVFLTNGQVYFGRLSNPSQDYVTLTDIYYLQVGPQQGSAQPNQPAPQQSITLVKLGNELHGPVDEMHINRSQVLFYEDLKEDGQVVKAILQDKAPKK